MKFAVDMTSQTINTTGMHISEVFRMKLAWALIGFQILPHGFRKVADTNIYSIIVDIPAFQLYEYKFLNGDQFLR
ncbi:MAG: hypothetical protein U0X76_06925 [Bacteroidia bacterium]